MPPYQNCTYFRETGRAVSMKPPMPRQVLQLPLTKKKRKPEGTKPSGSSPDRSGGRMRGFARPAVNSLYNCTQLGCTRLNDAEGCDIIQTIFFGPVAQSVRAGDS